ncbi:MAG: ABC transporter permease [Anaerolineae bacterium]|nr:ABC transporter permease [Gemmatimonadaceae bacterium]
MTRDTTRAPWWEPLSQDLGYAARGIRMRPGFAAVIVVTLALGIAANAIIFGIVDRLFIRTPAHVRAPEGVTRIYLREKASSFVGVDSTTSTVTTYPIITALREGVPSLAEVAGMFRTSFSLGRGSAAQQVDVSLVSGNFFRLLGVQPALGRFFLPEEDRPPVGAHVAVLSHGFWRRQFGGSRTAIGAQLLVGNQELTVVGVAPAGFNGVDLEKVDAWVPLSALASSVINDQWHSTPGSFWVQAIGRLKPGVTPERVSAEATVTFRRVVRSWNQSWRDSSGRVIAGPIVAARGPDAVPQGAKVSLWLIGVSAIVLLVACANVANLLLARAVRRRREIAVRLALGIGRGRLVRQLLVESLLLAALSAGLALLVAHWGGQLVRAILMPGIAWDGSPVDGRVLLFTSAAALLTGVLAGLAPALQASGADVASTLKLGAREGGGRRSSLRTGLLVAQAALSVVLLVGAGLFVRSLRNVQALDVGVDLARVLLVRMDLTDAGFQAEQVRDLYSRARERVRELPWVENAAVVSASVPTYMGAAASLRIAGRDSLPELPGGGPYYSAVSAGYFATLGSQIVRGRVLTEADEAARARVAIVNETLAKHYWPRENPIGQCVIIGDEKACTEIVGVVEDVVLFRIVGDPRGQLYLSATHPFVSNQFPAALLVRGTSDAPGLAGSVRREVQSLSPNMPFVGVSRFDELVAPQIQPWRLGATMFGVFGMLALVIAAVGLYSAIAYAVVQRTHEIGVRVALGAQQADVVQLVLMDGVRVVGIGLVMGMLGALAGGRWLEPLLYQTSPRDPAIFAVVALTLAGVAIAASLVPAWRAARTSPMVALRAE